MPEFIPNLGRAGSERVPQITGGGFFSELLTRTFGVDRANAILSGIAPGTRTRYETGWKHWHMFMVSQNKSPWITRSEPNWAMISSIF